MSSLSAGEIPQSTRCQKSSNSWSKHLLGPETAQEAFRSSPSLLLKNHRAILKGGSVISCRAAFSKGIVAVACLELQLCTAEMQLFFLSPCLFIYFCLKPAFPEVSPVAAQHQDTAACLIRGLLQKELLQLQALSLMPGAGPLRPACRFQEGSLLHSMRPTGQRNKVYMTGVFLAVP